MTFSGNVHSRSSLALVILTNDNIELKSSVNVAIDERIKSEITESKFKTEIFSVINLLSFLTDILAKITRPEVSEGHPKERQ